MMFPVKIDGEWIWFKAQTVWGKHRGVYHIFVGCIKCLDEKIPEQWYYVIREGDEDYPEYDMTEEDLTVITTGVSDGWQDAIDTAREALKQHIDATITKLQNLQPEITKIDGNDLSYNYHRPGGFVTKFCANERDGKWECYQAGHSHVTDGRAIKAVGRKQALAILTGMIHKEIADDIVMLMGIRDD